MSNFNGSYKKASFDNLKAVLEAAGAGDHFERASGAALTTEIKVEDNKWTITRIRPNKTVSNTFDIGTVAEFATLKPGSVAKCETSFENGVLSIKSTGKDYCHTIEKDGNNLKESVTVKGVTGVRISSP